MKNMLLCVVLFVLLQITSVFSQTLMDYVLETRGDTLVVKTQDDMGGEANALYHVISMDTIGVPAGRVYLLQAGGVYPLQNNPNGYADRVTRIIGSDFTPLVQNKNAANMLPLICGNVGPTGTNSAGLSSRGDLLVMNAALTPAANDETVNWAFTGTNHASSVIEYNNCHFERTKWIQVASFNPTCSFYLKNCYFVNLIGEPCRRNGGVYDGFANLNDFIAENCTHINTQGMMYKWRNYPAEKLRINHNTFVNCSGIQMMDLGSQKNAAYTNNLFVNANCQPFRSTGGVDDGEFDIDLQPMGLVNTRPDTALSNSGISPRFYVDRNSAYWDPYLANLADTCNSLAINGITNWASVQILMNVRTKGMFDNDAEYPYLVEGTNLSENPNFTDPKNLFGDALVELKRFTVSTVDTAYKNNMGVWRLVNTGVGDFVFFDWPIQVDLSYSNTALLSGGLGGFPIGDLNWFPTQKAQWSAQQATEYAEIDQVLNTGTVGVNEPSGSPSQFKLHQNYPNPFNPTTNINFTLAKSGYTTLKVVDILGREVATLVNGFTPAGSHKVEFNATNFASGVYFYKLSSGNFTEVMKMMLVK